MSGEARIIERKVLYAGDVVFREGSEGDVAYLVQEGSVEILKRRGDGTEVILGVVGKGGLFGEMALIDNQPRMATARAREQTTVALINRRQFEEKMERSDPFVRALLKIFTRNIRQITDRTYA